MRSGVSKLLVALAMVPIAGMITGLATTVTLVGAFVGGLSCGILLGWRSSDFLNLLIMGTVTGAVGGLLMLGVAINLGNIGMWESLVDVDIDLFILVITVASAGSAVASLGTALLSRMLER